MKKSILALVLAVMLVVSTGNVGLAQTLRSEQALAAGVSSIVISPQSPQVAKGGNEYFEAAIEPSTAQDTVYWTVTGQNSPYTRIDPLLGELTVALHETAAQLTVQATAGGKSATTAVTLTPPTHTHTADCLIAADIGIYWEQDYFSMNTSEPNAKTENIKVFISCTAAYPIAADAVVAIEVTGDYASILQATEISRDGSSSPSVRLQLKPGQTLQGIHSIPLAVTVDGVPAGEANPGGLYVKLYAEQYDPAYFDDTANIVVDLDNLQPSYTSTPVKINIPGGVRTIASVSTPDSASYTATLTDDGIVLTTKAINKVLSGVAPVTVTFKARQMPVVFNIPVRIIVSTPDLLSLEYEKLLDYEDTNRRSTIVTPVIAARYSDRIVFNATPLPTVTLHGVDGWTSDFDVADNRIKITGRAAGEGYFDYSVRANIALPGTNSPTLRCTLSLKNNPLKVSGALAEKSLEMLPLDTEKLDLNNPATYTRRFVLPDAADVTAIDFWLTAEEDSSVQYFDIALGRLDASGNLPVTVQMENNSALLFTEQQLDLDLRVTYADGDEKSLYQKVDIVANPPTVQAYRYNTSTPLQTDVAVLGERQKYTIRMNNRNGYKRLSILGDGITVVRGGQFLADMGQQETITVCLEDALSAGEQAGLRYRVSYAPSLVNPAVNLRLSSTESWTFEDSLITFTENRPSDVEDRPSSGNTSNTPATAEAIQTATQKLGGLAVVSEKDLPAGMRLATTASGKKLAVLPISLTTGSAMMLLDSMNALGAASANVGLELTVRNGIAGDLMTVILPGGFGAVNEPGRIGFTMDFDAVAPDAARMLAKVKDTTGTCYAMRVGGNFRLPTTATVTLKVKAPEGTTLHIYHYTPETDAMTYLCAAKVTNGQITFATQQMGQMLLTEKRIG